MTITINEKIINEFPEIKIRLAEPLSLYTNTKTGGPADIVAFPTTGKQAQALVLFAKENDLPLTVIGNASNLIVQDGGIRGLVMILSIRLDWFRICSWYSRFDRRGGLYECRSLRW